MNEKDVRYGVSGGLRNDLDIAYWDGNVKRRGISLSNDLLLLRYISLIFSSVLSFPLSYYIYIIIFLINFFTNSIYLRDLQSKIFNKL